MNSVYVFAASFIVLFAFIFINLLFMAANHLALMKLRARSLYEKIRFLNREREHPSTSYENVDSILARAFRTLDDDDRRRPAESRIEETKALINSARTLLALASPPKKCLRADGHKSRAGS